MKTLLSIAIYLASLGWPSLCHAALQDNGEGLIYDTDLDITWYAYPNYDTATYSGYQDWLNGLRAGGVAGWRFPTTTIDGAYQTTSTGEMGHLYYAELGNVSGSFTNAGPFSNYGGLNANYGGFYTSTPAGNGNLWYFDFGGYGINSGSQATVSPAYYYYWIHGLAVHDGQVGAAPRTPAEFNSDEHGDILWENTATGQRYVWLMAGAAFSSGVDLGNLSPQWHIAGTGDFNGDGKTDLVWENAATGDRYAWLMNGTTWLSSVYMGTLSTAWHIAGTGDFNRDGKTDLVWENATTGDRYLWLMNGTAWASSVYLGTVATDWSIASTGDFNGDRKTDLVWENTTTGDRYVWLMNGSAYDSSVYIGNAPRAWHIAGTGDFNEDNQTDIVWENTTTGERGVWLMSGASFSGWVGLGIVPTAWRIRN